MATVEALLDEARALSLEDRMRLIDALWDEVPSDAEIELHAEWTAELERRIATLKDRASEGVPWSQVRDEALARLGHASQG